MSLVQFHQQKIFIYLRICWSYGAYPSQLFLKERVTWKIYRKTYENNQTTHWSLIYCDTRTKYS